MSFKLFPYSSHFCKLHRGWIVFRLHIFGKDALQAMLSLLLHVLGRPLMPRAPWMEPALSPANQGPGPSQGGREEQGWRWACWPLEKSRLGNSLLRTVWMGEWKIRGKEQDRGRTDDPHSHSTSHFTTTLRRTTPRCEDQHTDSGLIQGQTVPPALPSKPQQAPMHNQGR